MDRRTHLYGRLPTQNREQGCLPCGWNALERVGRARLVHPR